METILNLVLNNGVAIGVMIWMLWRDKQKEDERYTLETSLVKATESFATAVNNNTVVMDKLLNTAKGAI